MIALEGYRLKPYEEAVGTLGEVQGFEDYALAKIGPVTVALPVEMVERLRSFKGQRVGVIRTETDFRLRVITAQ